MKKFINFINEGRGISNNIKEYSKVILDYLKAGNYNQYLDLDHEPLPLMNLVIIFRVTDDYSGLFDPSNSYLEDGKLYNILINFEIPENFDENKVLGIISHELTHVREYLAIVIRTKNLDVKIHPIHIEIKNINKEFLKDIKTFDTFYDLL